MHRLALANIVLVVWGIALLYWANGFSSLSTPRLAAVVLAIALPAVIAALTWPPVGVLITAFGLFLFVLPALALNGRLVEQEPAVGGLLVADSLAVALAAFRPRVVRRREENAGLAEIRQALADGCDLEEIADVVAWSGRRVMGPGTLRLWLIDRQRAELRMVWPRNPAAVRHGPDPETLRSTPDRIRLDSSDPRARAARLAQPAEGVADPGLGWAETPLDGQIRPGQAVYVGVGLGESYGMLRGFFGDRFLGRSGHDATLAVPVQWRGETVGVVAYSGASSSRRFTVDDRARLARVAALGAAAIGERQQSPEA
jgi:hypothetical protein